MRTTTSRIAPVLALAAILHAPRASAEDEWQPIGEPVLIDADVWLNDPTLVTTPDGAPLLSFATGPWNLAGVVHVWRGEGTRWRPLGGPIDGALSTLALDPHGRPYLCSARPLRLLRWEDDAWVGVGGDVAQQTGLTQRARFSVEGCTGVGFTRGDAPVISFVGHDAPKLATNRTAFLDGDVWRTPEEPVISQGVTARSRLVRDAQGTQYLAAFAGAEVPSMRREVRVLRGEGTRWMQVGDTFDDALDPALALVDARLHLAFHKRDGSVVVQRLDGDTWSTLPSPGAGTNPALAVDGRGRLVLARAVTQVLPPPEVATLAVAVSVLDDGAWTALTSIENGLLFGGARLAVTVDGDERVVVAAAGTASRGAARLFARRLRSPLP